MDHAAVSSRGWIQAATRQHLAGGRPIGLKKDRVGTGFPAAHPKLVPQRRALREFAGTPARQGRLENPWERLIGGLAPGGEEFAQTLLKTGKVERSEQTAVRRLEWASPVEAAEAELGRSWKTLVEAHGDWGCDGVLFVAVRCGRHPLAEVVRHIPGLKYAAAAQAVERFALAVAHDASRSRFVTRPKFDRHLFGRDPPLPLRQGSDLPRYASPARPY